MSASTTKPVANSWLTAPMPAHLLLHPISQGQVYKGSFVGGAKELEPAPKQPRIVFSTRGEQMTQTSDGKILRTIFRGEPAESLFSQPVLDWNVQASADKYGGSYEGILSNGKLQLIDSTGRTNYPETHDLVAVSSGCLATSVPATQPIPCFQHEYGTGYDRLRQYASFGPVSKAEWIALTSMKREVLAGWENAGGPFRDSDVLQIAGDADGDDVLVCAVLIDHTVACWGTSRFGELGDGTTTAKLRLAHIAELHDVADLAVGHRFACARTSQGQAWCWGATGYAYPSPTEAAIATTKACQIDEAATEKTNREIKQREVDRVKACLQRPCAGLDCQLGCSVNEYTRTIIYRHDGECMEKSAPMLSRPVVLKLPQPVDTISATADRACFVYRDGTAFCGTS
jgi:hypothetical protein